MRFGKMAAGMTSLVLIMVFAVPPGFTQEEKAVRVAIEAVRGQMRVPKEIEIKFVEKKESPIPDFYSVKLFLLAPDREIPVVVYVDKAGEKVILGNLIIKGENLTQKEAGPSRPRKIDMGQLEIERSPWRGPENAKVTVVEFSNFECQHCLTAWTKLKEFLEKHPKEIKYVFKHFPLQGQGKPVEISEMIAACQELGREAFWPIHDFFFSSEGQSLVKGEKAAVKKKIEEILKEKGYDPKAYQAALETGKGKKRVEEDLALGNKLRVKGTPTTLINGEFVRNPVTDNLLSQYLKK